jgi:hypothetical protein
MDYRIFIFSRNELKIILVGTVIGGIFQLICWKYLKNHPELLNNENSEKLEPKRNTSFLKKYNLKNPDYVDFFRVEVHSLKLLVLKLSSMLQQQ